MKPNVLIDSHGWIEYFSNGPKAQKYAQFIDVANTHEYITPSIILYEVYKKLKSVSGETAALQAAAYIIEHTVVVSIDKMLAIAAAEISIKTKLPMADAIIKAVAEHTNAKLVTGDSHFSGLSDVIFIR